MATQAPTRPVEDNETRAVTADNVVAAARNIAQGLKGRGREIEAARRVPADVIEQAHEAGIFKIIQPARAGGFELGWSTLLRASIELAQGDGSSAWCIGLSAAHNWIVGLYPAEAQDEIWDDPANIVAGSYMPVGKCRPVDGGFNVMGSWSFASNCDNCQWFIVGAMTPPLVDGGPPTPRWFLIPASQARIEDTWFTSGLSGTGSKTIVVDDEVFVPAYRVLTVPQVNSSAAPGTEVNTSALFRLTFTGTGPALLAGLAVGMAKRAPDELVATAATKMMMRPGGPPLPMKDSQAVQEAIAAASAKCDTAELILLNTYREIEEGLTQDELPSTDLRIRHRRDHGFAAKLAAQAVVDVYDVLGASVGYLSDPIQRVWRDVNMATRHISLNWPSTMAVYGQHRLGLPPTAASF